MVKIQDFITALQDSLATGSFVRLTLGNYKGVEPDLKNIHVRRITVKREERLSFTYRFKTRDIVKNHKPDESIEMIGNYLGTGFRHAALFTTAFDMTLDNGKLKKSDPTEKEAPPLEHDRQKNRLIEAAGQSYLHDLKITDAAGNVYKSAQDKYRQINKYVEILSTLIKNIPADKLRRVVDMGSGKGYLTFALYDYLHNTLNYDTAVTGVEYRTDMVDLCNDIAKRADFKKLDFVQGSIDDFDSRGTDILIALHACDTATDDAIAKGIAAGSELIVVAPCCHKQIRREIEAHKSVNDLDFVMKHGIFVERQAEMVTDALRALILEYCGYNTKVFEFISDAHTPKNILIVGTRNPKAQLHDPQILQKIHAAKNYFGIKTHHLERAVGL
ncbi:MAG: SAM-dependent methyltransferase [Alphaproteobacteria bacterium]|nr:SAM-dependent methyltransferase [Alphaproteobacteria bacterium]